MIKFTRPSATKIFPRERLFDQMDRLREQPAIWIAAPAGAGKTTLASSYAEARHLPCLWYQCDQGDADLATFFHHLGQATIRATPRKRGRLPLLTVEYLQGIPTFTLRFFEALFSRLPKPALLVFDNYQDVPEDAPLHEIMPLALSRIPEGINAIVLSRNAPPATLIRLQANGQLGLLDWQALRLTGEETRGLLALRSRRPTPAETADRLHAACDGWAAGLILCFEAAVHAHDLPVLTDDRFFEGAFCYFMREVFADLPPETQRFLLSTAHFPKMTGAMAEELLGETEAGEMLRRMSRRNFFVARHHGPKGAFIYHPLFREFLLDQARRFLPPEEYVALQRKAAAILESDGQTEAAVGLLTAIADWQGMSTIILSHAPGMLRQGRYLALRRWVDRLPDEVVADNPWLLFWKGMSRVFLAPPQARGCFEQAFAGFRAEEDRVGAVLAASWCIAAILFSYEDFPAIDRWQAVLGELAADLDMLPAEVEATALSSLVMAWGFRDRPPADAERLERRVEELTENEATATLKMHALRTLYWRRLFYRSASEALPLLDRMRQLAEAFPDQPLLKILYLSSSMRATFCAGQHEEMLHTVDSLLELSRHTGLQSEAETAWACIGAVASCLGRLDTDGARSWLARMPPREQWSPWARSFFHAQSARMALIEGNIPQGLADGKLALELSMQVGGALVIADNRLLLARLHVLAGKQEEAVRLLGQARRYAEEADCRFLLSIALLIEADLALTDGDETLGLDRLRQSLSLARRGGHVYGMCDDPRLVLDLCERALEADIETDHVQLILRRRELTPERPPAHLERWPWPVAIRTLGETIILLDGKPVTFARKAQRKPLALLKALIAMGASEVPEERLSDALWPDAEGDMAHQAMEVTLHRLRKLLGRPDAVVFRAGRMSLNQRFCWVDAIAFERLLALAEQAERQGRGERRQALLEQAVALFRGPFLGADVGEWWTQAPAARLRGKWLQTLWQLALLLEDAQQWDRAADCFERCLEADDALEATYRHLMHCRHRQGRPIEALEAYRRCRLALAAARGVVPSPQTEALRDAILTDSSFSGPTPLFPNP